MHRSDITVLLKEMVGEKLLTATGIGKGTKYALYKEPNATSVISRNATSSDAYLGTLFSIEEDDSEENGTSGISTNASSDISSSNTSSKTNIRTEKIHSAVLDVCAADFKSLADIAKGVNRTKGHLKRQVIPALLQSGRLVRKYPDVPNHPEQQYKTVKDNDN